MKREDVAECAAEFVPPVLPDELLEEPREALPEDGPPP
jgi:hypothetical protein